MAAPSFGGYTALTTTTTAQNKTDIVANLNKFLALITAPGPNSQGYGNQPSTPDFDIIPPAAAQQITNEINALITVINGSP